MSDMATALRVEVAGRVTGLLQRAFSLICLFVLGTLLYVTSIDPARASFEGRVLFGVAAQMQARVGVSANIGHAPTACSLTLDLLPADHSSCTESMVLEPAGPQT